MDESVVINEILKGDRRKFELLIRANNQLLYRTLRGLFVDQSTIQDLMQETYIVAFEKLSSFKQDSKFSTWIIRIALNLSYRRLNNVNKTSSDLGIENLSIEHIEKVTHHDRSMQLEEENQELLKKTLERVIDQLSPENKIVFILKEIEGLSIREISESIGISESNVKVRIHRAKLNLKKALLREKQLKSVFEFGNNHCDLIVTNVFGRIF